MAKAAAMDAGYQLKITLQGSKPPIWRRVVVMPTLTFASLHQVIQLAMGWDDCHLHEFNVNGERIGRPPAADDLMGMEADDDLRDERKVRLSQFLLQPKQKFSYTYDFGDSWEHLLVLEKILPGAVAKPICLAGKMACPPEDCGGLYGYMRLLDVLSHPRHPEHEEMKEWCGDNWDAEAFDVEATNRCLAKVKS